MPGNIDNIVLVRPGALGDVLVARGVIRFLRDAFPRAGLTLLAPGERGRLFRREDWAERVFDWDGAEFGWLFSDGTAPPGRILREAFRDCDLLVAFIDPARGGAALLARLAEIAPRAERYFSAPHPGNAADEPVGAWLLRGVAAFCRERGWLPPDAERDLSACLASRLQVSVPATGFAGGETLMLHPGSGSRGKNWPVENFAGLAGRLLSLRGAGGGKAFARCLVTQGEADGNLGERLRGMVDGAELAPRLSLPELAGLLAGARLYVGNDSGVSHLAAVVSTPTGAAPRVAALFGPSNARIWAPPGALVLDAGEGMRDLPPEAAYAEIARFLALA